MSDYFWLEFAGRPPRERYPEWVEAVEQWREFIDGGVLALQRLLDALVARRASVPWGVAGTELSRPRLFVSHRRDDEPRAREVAALAQVEGFQVWLDVLDSGLQRAAQASTGTPADTMAIALFIEMALLNCTHVIALITPRTPGTYWVPYEYGRVKDSSAHSLSAASWIDQHVVYEPEYLQLGVKTRSDDEIRDWLRSEMSAWDRRFPSSAAKTQHSPAIAPSLTPELNEAIDGFRDGPGRPLVAPEPASVRRRPRRPGVPADPMALDHDITVKPPLRVEKQKPT